MCLILIALKKHPLYDIVLLANRDEFYDRPASPAGFWSDYPYVLAGRDLQAGGTWLGITNTGRLAGLTNYRDPLSRKKDAPTRGKLVSSFLTGKEAMEEYINKIDIDASFYNKFNIILGIKDRMFYYSNYNRQAMELLPGIHGLSNHLLDTPWPKVVKGKMLLENMISDGGTIDPSEAFKYLQDRERPVDESLPDTGVGIERERMLSPMFITSPDYGTRSSTLLLVDRSGHVAFFEKTHDPVSGQSKTVEYRFYFG